MDNRNATPFETYQGSGSKFELPDGSIITVTEVKAKTENVGDKTFAGIELTGVDESGESHTEFLWAGQTDRVVPHNGVHLRSVAETKTQFAVSSSSRLGVFQDSLNSLQFPWNGDLWDKEGYSQLVGYTLTIERRQVIGKDGKPQMKKSGTTGTEYPVTNCAVSAWTAPETKKSVRQAAVQSAKTSSPSSTSSASPEIVAAVENVVLDAISEGAVAKSALTPLLNKTFENVADRVAAIKLVSSDWFTSDERVWKVENGKVSLKE